MAYPGTSRGVLLAIILAFLGSAAAAQSQIGGLTPAGKFGSSGMAMRSHPPFSPAGRHFGTPFFYPGFYTPYDYVPYGVEYLPPEPPPQPAPVPEVKIEPLPDPVLLELRGNEWVKVTNFTAASDRALSGANGKQQASARPMPPAVLVFRDGHTEELSNYSIIGQAIHTKADYWTTGAWTRTIQISALDVPATLKQNQERGVKFELPSSPDEIYIRP